MIMVVGKLWEWIMGFLSYLYSHPRVESQFYIRVHLESFFRISLDNSRYGSSVGVIKISTLSEYLQALLQFYIAFRISFLFVNIITS